MKILFFHCSGYVVEVMKGVLCCLLLLANIFVKDVHDQNVNMDIMKCLSEECHPRT